MHYLFKTLNRINIYKSYYQLLPKINKIIKQNTYNYILISHITKKIFTTIQILI